MTTDTTMTRDMLREKIVRAIPAIALVLGSCSASAETLSGPARILDGDTVGINDIHIRLAGIDAPEKGQVCLDATGQPWRCGIGARSALASLAGAAPWSCELQVKPDRYGRRLGTCYVNGEDIGGKLVAAGYALSYRRYGHVYDGAEDAARSAKVGLWSGAFYEPWNWRHRTCSTEVLGAVSVPIDARDKLCRR